MGNDWSDEERGLYDKDRQSHEGKGEKSYRSRMGLSTDVVGSKNGDVPELCEEVKNVEANDGKFDPVIRLGRDGKAVFLGAVINVAQGLVGKELDKDVLTLFASGEVSTNKLLGLPDEIRELMFEELRLSKAIVNHSALILTTSVGFLRIPREDYDAAFELSSITQASPKYKLKRDYVEQALLSTHLDENLSTRHSDTTDLNDTIVTRDYV